MLTLDENRFKEVFRQYYNPLCNFAATITKDDVVAQDVVQEVFTHLWDKRENLSFSANEKSYLFTAVKNKAIEILRKKNTESQMVEVMKQLNSEKIEDQAEKYILREKINKSINTLPEKCKEVFHMSKINGMTYKEIASELDISVKTVENHIGKAYRLLRQALSGTLTI